MRIFPPDPEIGLYRTGFGKGPDLFKRIKAFSNLVERVENPLVIALDGPWGSGKIYFLRRSVGAR